MRHDSHDKVNYTQQTEAQEMNLPQRIYAAIRKEYPGGSDIAVSQKMDLGVTYMSRMRRGIGIGVAAAEWLAFWHDSDENDNLLFEAIQAELLSRRNGATKQSATQLKRNAAGKFRLNKLPKHLQQMVGYREVA